MSVSTTYSGVQERGESKFRILVIDDEPSLVRVLTAAFREYGHEVVSASSGCEGVDIFRKQPVDVIVCDLGMPDMTGVQVAGQIGTICRQRCIPKPPFILLTGSEASADQAHSMEESGVDLVVEKPAGVHRLMEAIARVVCKDERGTKN